MSKTIPRKDADFDEVQAVITTKTTQNLGNWMIDALWYNNQLIPAQSRWTMDWTAWQNPNTRTSLITFTKNEARKNYEPLLRKLVEMLKSSSLVTPADLKEMGILTDKGGGGGHHPAPNTYPDADIDSSTIRRLGIHFFDHGSKSHAKPHGIHGAGIRWGLREEAPTDINLLNNSSFVTHSPFTFDFNEADRGKTLWFCLCWENTTGEKGPWGEIGSAIIP
ncbi:MAG: hypothetical protein LBJ72_01385 [Dysgonamonadaceae bacterium]|jgi:hypothetical protein|nr:hypothetical protein [Dysgonamonadaceae bacterium]